MATKARGRRNDGSVTERKDGRFMARYIVTLPDGTRKRQAVYGKTNEEARSKMRREMYLAGSGAPILHNGVKVEEYLYSWLETASRISDGTRSKYEGVVRKHILPYLGKVNLSSLTSVQVQNMLDSQLRNGVSIRVAQIIRNTLSSALRTAENKGLVTKNVARNVELPSYETPEKEVWDEGQVTIFRTHAEKNKYHLLFEMLLTYGLRRGEALALSWEDIDFKNGIIHVRKQYTYVGNDMRIVKPKTKNSVRDLPIVPHIEAMLRSECPGEQSDPIVAVGGLPVKPTSLDYEFKRIIKDSGLPNVTMHSLRHFVATTLGKLGVSLKDAQMILGHASPYTTMQHYQHSTIGNKMKSLEIYAKSMSF